MSKSSKVMREDTQPTFAKGMTLQQYMNKNMGKPPPDAIGDQQVQEENLYQSTINRKLEGVKSKNDLYFINEIDEQSVQDSIEQALDEESMGLLKSQRTKETLLENNQAGENRLRTRVNSISMNATAFFKSSNQQKNTFRIKRMSMSPVKKKTEPSSTYGSITLYGSKFGKQASKNSFKQPQLVTFYGKLKHNTHETYQKDGFLTLRKQESKGNLTKKHQLEINQLIEYESNINNKYFSRNSAHQIKVQGIKDRLCQRKNKFC